MLLLKALVLSDRGRKREDTRAQLDGILDALNLNGSNPIAVMTQDITRSFLAGSNEKSDRKKFDIYMEATLLAQSQENYQVCCLCNGIHACKNLPCADAQRPSSMTDGVQPDRDVRHAKPVFLAKHALHVAGTQQSRNLQPG